MTLSCEAIQGRFGSYSAEDLPGEERRAVREHLKNCAGCREAAAARDPLLVFASAQAAPISPEETGRVFAAVRAGIALQQVEQRLEAPGFRRRAGALASAAAALALTLLAPGPAYRTSSPASVPPAERRAAESRFVPAGNLAPAPPPEILRNKGAEKYPADATIYELNPGAGQPRVVWIVDRSIDI